MPTRSSPALKPLPADPSERYVIPNLRNACRILKHLGRLAGSHKGADLARELGIPVTTTLRIMATLTLEGLIRKNGGQYELGPVVIQLGNASLAGTEISTAALPVLASLTARTDETSHLAIPCDGRSLIVAVQDSPHPLRAASRPGFLAALHCSSTGKIFLTYLHGGTLPGVTARQTLDRHTPRTLVTLAELRRESVQTKQRGYSLDDEEFAPGVRCLAAPVFSSTGAVVAAIGITAATIRFTKERIPEMAAHVQAAAAELSASLGHNGNS